MALVGIEQLTPYDDYAGTHPRKQLEQIFESIRKFGFNNLVLMTWLSTSIKSVEGTGGHASLRERLTDKAGSTKYARYCK